MESIKLSKNVWYFDQNSQLGPEGGFGAVFRGSSENGTQVAVKRLKIEVEQAGHRELEIAEELAGKNYKNVLAVLDSGIDSETGRYFVVMVIADKSLEEHIPATGLVEKEAVEILTHIANGLQEVIHIVHRDLKPLNILLHKGVWKITDFGIARFVEKSTSIQTVKGWLSREYAAPEQWRLERATNATDIYALGCIAYALLTGNPPFTGIDKDDYRKQHLNSTPPLLPVSPRLNQLLMMCLRKNPKVRPSLVSVCKQLENIYRQPTQNPSLASAAQQIAQKSAKQEAKAGLKEKKTKERESLAKEALDMFRTIVEDLYNFILTDAPIADRSSNGIKLGDGRLEINIKFPTLPLDSFSYSGKDIVCGAVIAVEQGERCNDYLGRSANLWFGDFANDGDYRWWEVAYYNTESRNKEREPFAIGYRMSGPYKVRDADLAAGSAVYHNIQHAIKPVAIDGEYFGGFAQRWSERMALASQNKLQPPRNFPEA